jgi:hypothetical protein
MDIVLQDGFLWLWESDNVGKPTAIKGSGIVAVRVYSSEISQIWVNSIGPCPVFMVRHSVTEILTAISKSYSQASRR